MSEKASSAAKVRDLYEESAEWYAEMMDKEIDLPVYADILGRLSKRLHGIEGAVFDTSCGPGHMLSKYGEECDPDRRLVGTDLSPKMIAIARARLPSTASVAVADMRNLEEIESESMAAVLSFFALHHIDHTSVEPTLREWLRVLRPGGQLVVATWEGAGRVDYGAESDIVAMRYTELEMRNWMTAAGFTLDRCKVEPVADMQMDAIYIECTK